MNESIFKDDQDFFKSFQLDRESGVLLKTKGLPAGTIRDWKGQKYQKQVNGEWRPVSKGKGTKEIEKKSTTSFVKNAMEILQKEGMTNYPGGSGKFLQFDNNNQVKEASKILKKYGIEIQVDSKNSAIDILSSGSAEKIKLPKDNSEITLAGKKGKFEYHDPSKGYAYNIASFETNVDGKPTCVTFYRGKKGSKEEGEFGAEMYRGMNYIVGDNSRSWSKNFKSLEGLPKSISDVVNELKKIHSEKYGIYGKDK